MMITMGMGTVGVVYPATPRNVIVAELPAGVASVTLFPTTIEPVRVHGVIYG